jgi:hypothetical protein
MAIPALAPAAEAHGSGLTLGVAAPAFAAPGSHLAVEWRLANDGPLPCTVNVHVSVEGAPLVGVRCRNAKTSAGAGDARAVVSLEPGARATLPRSSGRSARTTSALPPRSSAAGDRSRRRSPPASAAGAGTARQEADGESARVTSPRRAARSGRGSAARRPACGA